MGIISGINCHVDGVSSVSAWKIIRRADPHEFATSDAPGDASSNASSNAPGDTSSNTSSNAPSDTSNDASGG